MRGGRFRISRKFRFIPIHFEFDSRHVMAGTCPVIHAVQPLLRGGQRQPPTQGDDAYLTRPRAFIKPRGRLTNRQRRVAAPDRYNAPGELAGA
jgi:hypothetical protein